MMPEGHRHVASAARDGCRTAVAFGERSELSLKSTRYQSGSNLLLEFEGAETRLVEKSAAGKICPAMLRFPDRICALRLFLSDWAWSLL